MVHEHDMVDDRGSIEPERATSGIYTETLARLYWRQGFLDKALDIYGHLVRVQPTNRQLRHRMEALERQLVAATPGNREGKTRTEWVIAHLERWLHHLRQQRAARENAG